MNQIINSKRVTVFVKTQSKSLELIDTELYI
jgi:hypothetical protein